jgi:ankyrin repeat protein
MKKTPIPAPAPITQELTQEERAELIRDAVLNGDRKKLEQLNYPKDFDFNRPYPISKFSLWHSAAYSKHPNSLEILEYLLEQAKLANIDLQPSLNSYSAGGCTPIHLAILSRSLTAVKLLVKYGANPLMPAASGKSSFDLVERSGMGGGAELVFARIVDGYYKIQAKINQQPVQKQQAVAKQALAPVESNALKRAFKHLFFFANNRNHIQQPEQIPPAHEAKQTSINNAISAPAPIAQELTQEERAELIRDAVLAGDRKKLEQLNYPKDFDFNRPYPISKFSLWHSAAYSAHPNRLEILEYLLEQAKLANIDLQPSLNSYSAGGCTPIHLAILSRSLTAVELLVKYGANPLIPAADGESSLNLVARSGIGGGAELVFAEIVDNYYKIQAKINQQPAQEQQAVAKQALAPVESNTLKRVFKRLFFSTNNRSNIQQAEQIPPTHEVKQTSINNPISAPAPIAQEPTQEERAELIRDAVLAGDRKKLEQLNYPKDFDFNRPYPISKFSLWHSAAYSEHPNRLEILEYILEQAKLANIDLQPSLNSYSAGGCTPIHLAILSRNLKAVKLLVKYGADPLIPAANGESSLDLVANSGIGGGAELVFAEIVDNYYKIQAKINQQPAQEQQALAPVESNTLKRAFKRLFFSTNNQSNIQQAEQIPPTHEVKQTNINNPAL